MLPENIGVPGVPGREAVADVMSECNCTEERAIKLLQVNFNNQKIWIVQLTSSVGQK